MLRLPAPPRLRLPSQCEVCRGWTTDALCAACVSRFAAPRPRCARCGLALGLAAPACGECLRDPPPFEHTVCVADYGFPWDRLITGYKFHGRVELAGAFAALMSSAVRASSAPLPQRVLPVPLAPARLAERGYNHAWELARRIAADLRLPAQADLLQRPITTEQQTGLGRAARQRNLRSAFMVDPGRRQMLAGQRVALVDDVLTTGATARASAAILLRAGAAAVDVWVFARTPES